MRSRLTPAARLLGRKVLRYSLVSMISIAVSQSVLMIAFGMLHWTARLANVAACAVATVPSYYLNRSWPWGRRGRSHLWKEVVPFWAIAFLGLASPPGRPTSGAPWPARRPPRMRRRRRS